MKLHGYDLSSATYRVRIALALKGIVYERIEWHPRRREHEGEAYGAINPQRLIPTLVDGERALTQSLAIIEYLDETHPEPALLPADPAGRARVRSLANIVACDIHPLDNLRVLRYLKHDLGVDDETRAVWYAHWIALGFTALERMLVDDSATGTFCHGETPGVADVCLVPQVANARRAGCDLDPYPTIRRIDEACRSLPPFVAAAPSG